MCGLSGDHRHKLFQKIVSHLCQQPLASDRVSNRPTVHQTVNLRTIPDCAKIDHKNIILFIRILMLAIIQVIK